VIPSRTLVPGPGRTAGAAVACRAASVLAALLLNSCVMNWQAQNAAPAQVIQSSGESRIRVTLNNGINVVIRDPWVEGDSLVGWQQPTGDPAMVPVARRAFALTDVRTVSVSKSNTGANIAIGAAIGAAAFVGSVVVVLLIACGAGSCD
jgi:hypothetical protein